MVLEKAEIYINSKLKCNIVQMLNVNITFRDYQVERRVSCIRDSTKSAHVLYVITVHKPIWRINSLQQPSDVIKPY